MTKQYIDIIKRSRKRRPEHFSRDKLHSSIRSACLSVRSYPGDADITAGKVCDAVIVWLDNKPEATSNDLRRVASEYLRQYHPDAAYIYEHHRYTI